MVLFGTPQVTGKLYTIMLYGIHFTNMISVLASSVVDRTFEPMSGQTKDYKIASPLYTQYEGIYAKTCWLGVSIIKIQLSVFVKSKTDIIIILWNITRARHDMAVKCSFGVKQ